jgi:coenzyme F420-reducing hydrogenase delta subunit
MAFRCHWCSYGGATWPASHFDYSSNERGIRVMFPHVWILISFMRLTAWVPVQC